ncbi:MAG: ABC transporter permease [Bdellovibrionaceae bacterium]|nr:ABC transporter permease [Bdellovibrionales bacterium]MCB9254363.1 ABC transporter permease [Pseudobdellovibrionaceae bacterium]
MPKEKAIDFLILTKTRSLDSFFRGLDFLGGAANLFYASCRVIFRPPFHFGLFVEQCYSIGVKSFSIVFITALSIGFVMSIQFGYGLERFGGKIYVPRVVGLSIMRELGPVMTCLMLAGRVGSGIAAELGSMSVTQQIDAIRALGTDPLKRLVIPRLLALLLMCPLLTVMADLIGIMGGMVLSQFELNLNADYYFHQSIMVMAPNDFLVGVAKTLVFAVIIGVTSCYYGLQTKGGTQGVGQSTTHAVVTSSILITIFDFVLTKLFLLMEVT